jgi:dTDP-4-amino-4,6-dideoxygalactose transaminase
MIPLANPQIGHEECEAVTRIMRNGQLAAGAVVDAFESEFAAYCGADHGVATSNGTTALHAALHALGIGEGDRVITTPFTFVATANTVRLVGAEPLFVDIDPETYALDPAAVEAALVAHDNVAAILAVHLYGHPAPMNRLEELAATHDVALVEDAAQAHGAELDGRRVGSLGDVACFSFYPTKNMTTSEGGMVTTDDERVAERARRFVDHGRHDGRHVSVGHNFRMTNLEAAIGRVQLERLPAFTEARRETAAVFTEAFEESAVTPPVETPAARHVYHQYTVRAPDRDGLAEHLRAAGIDTGVYYPRPVHLEPAYADVSASFPRAERAAREVLSLPVHPGVTPADRETITAAVESYAPPA